MCRPPPSPLLRRARHKKIQRPLSWMFTVTAGLGRGKKSLCPRAGSFFRILEGLWQDSCTSRKKPDFTCAGLFLGTRRLGARHSETRPRPAQSLSQDFFSLFTDKEAHQKPCQGRSPSFFIQVLKKAFWGEGKNITPLQGFFPRPAGIFLSLSGSARAKTRAGGNVQNSSQSTGP